MGATLERPFERAHRPAVVACGWSSLAGAHRASGRETWCWCFRRRAFAQRAACLATCAVRGVVPALLSSRAAWKPSLQFVQRNIVEHTEDRRRSRSIFKASSSASKVCSSIVLSAGSLLMPTQASLLKQGSSLFPVIFPLPEHYKRLARGRATDPRKNGFPPHFKPPISDTQHANSTK